jgi:ribonuclease VapC
MIVDSSAVIAIAFDEPERARLVDALVTADKVRVAAPTWLEVALVLGGSRLTNPEAYLAGFEREWSPEFIPFSREHIDAAREAWTRFGKGNHPARLNFGDCMSYAAAKVAGEALLYVGNHFAQTDIESAL